MDEKEIFFFENQKDANLQSEKLTNTTVLLGNESKINLELLRRNAIKQWIVLHSLNFFVIFWCWFFEPGFSEVVRKGQLKYGHVEQNFLDLLAAQFGGFLVMMIIPWSVAGIHRLIKKRPSTPTLFIFYYFIFLCWSFYLITKVILINNYFHLNPFDMFNDPIHQDLLYGTSFILAIVYGIILLAYWDNKRIKNKK